MEHVSLKPRRERPALSTKPMRRESLRTLLFGLAVAFDAIALILGFQVVEAIRDYRWLSPGGVSLAVLAIPAYVYFGVTNSGYSADTLERISTSVSSAWRALLGAVVVMIVCAFLAKFSMKISRSAFVYAILSSSALLVVSRTVVASVIRWGLDGRTSDRLLITDRLPMDLPCQIDVLDLSCTDLRPDQSDPAQLSLISERISPYDLVYLQCDGDMRDEWVATLKASGVPCELVVPSKSIHAAVGIGRLGESDTLILSRGSLSLGSRVQKRLFDLAMAIPLLILTGPLMAVVAVLIRLEAPGPALFSQVRIGQANRPFRIYKFRSMRLGSLDSLGERSTAREPTAWGRGPTSDMLPSTTLNNCGSSSMLVRRMNRPTRVRRSSSRAGEQLFWEVSDLYWMRHALKPGITGLAQINGFRGATHCRDDLETRLRYDLEYLQTWSLWNDLTILFATLKVVSHDNAY